MIFSTVLQFLMDPNAPPPLKIVSSVSYENILIDSTLMKHFVGLKSSQFEVLHSLLDDVSPFAANRFPSSMLGSSVMISSRYTFGNAFDKFITFKPCTLQSPL